MTTRALSTRTSPTRSAKKVRTALDEGGNKGAFVRTDSAWRSWVSKDPASQFPAEKDRYHLYVAYACPWAHRTLMMRAIKGLEDSITVTVVHPTWQKTKPDEDEHTGWVFGDPNGKPFMSATGNGGPFPAAFPNNEPDPFVNAKSVRDVYDYAKDTDGKYSVPILWDKKAKTIVSNESAEIIRMLNSEFNALAKYPDIDCYPEEEKIRKAIDDVNEWVYPNINNGVYRCGFAKSQEAYDEAVSQMTEAFDRVDGILQKQRYIAGDKFTEADIRLFVTLLRFDEVYIVYFKTNTRSVASTPAILNYCREIYQMPGVKETVDMEQIKQHYFTSHPNLNYYSIVPKGNFFHLLDEPHNRKD
jgi:putative glutathione S-transferase